MRQSITSVLAVALIFVGLSSAHAQEQLTVTVPFSFVLNNSTLPAGTYSIRQTFLNQQKSLFLRGDGSAASVLATTFDDGIRGDKLVFHRYGNRYFLTDVAMPNGNLHFRPLGSQIRKEVPKEEVAVSGK